MPVGKKLRTQAPEGPTPQTASLVPSLGFPEPFYDRSRLELKEIIWMD